MLAVRETLRSLFAQTLRDRIGELVMRELKKIDKRVFARGAYVKSWGCHTGESMSKLWRDATGTRMWGAIGKTDYSTGELPALSSAGGKWVN